MSLNDNGRCGTPHSFHQHFNTHVVDGVAQHKRECIDTSAHCLDAEMDHVKFGPRVPDTLDKPVDEFTDVSDIDLVQEVDRRKLANQVATTSTDADTMVEICEKCGVKFLCGCHWLDIEAKQHRQETDTPIHDFCEASKS